MECVGICILFSISYLRHIGQVSHLGKGRQLLSKLSGDIKKQKTAEEEVTRTLDGDLREKNPSEQVVPYSDKLLCQIAVKWLAAMDQVSNMFLQLIF